MADEGMSGPGPALDGLRLPGLPLDAGSLAEAAGRLYARIARVPAETQLLAYTRASVELVVQRQLIFLATLILSVFYYDALFGAIFYGLTFLCDVCELRWSRRIQAAGRIPPEEMRRNFAILILFTIWSSGAIALFVTGTALLEGTNGHFTPLFFLLAAAIFATMNNHQVTLALTIRLIFYGAVFIYVPARDIWAVAPPLGSVIWLHFFTSVFVLFFVLDCARVFLTLYKQSLRRMEALRAEEARATQALALQTQFLSVVSHELRTPLTSINGAIALAQSPKISRSPEAVVELLSVASRNGKRLAALVNDILDVQKLSAGEMKFSVEEVDLEELARECVEVNAHLSQEVRLVGQFDAGPLGEVQVDRFRLLQVLTNVVSNAVKFSPRGSVVEVGTYRRRGLVGISVRDSGRGIPPGHEDIVFGQFTQVDSSDRREKQGSGLGMSIARRIMSAIGGTIRYESEMGRGTTFYLEFAAPE